MDVLVKLRVLIWVLVIGLWGVMVYQYLGEDEAGGMRPIVNPYAGEGPAAPAPDDIPTAAEEAPPASTPPPAPETAVTAGGDPASNVIPLPDAVGPASALEAGRRAGAVAEGPLARPPAAARVPIARAPRRSWREERGLPLPDPPVPPGFQKTVTRHFNIYAEHDEASEGFIELVENLHANLMLDLAPFSPWAGDQKVSIFLFKKQETYRSVTGRPPWSGGASSVAKRKVYVYESDELPGILAHELTHIYFDGFFLGGANDPLWLSEGMATLVQVERGLSEPNWLKENMTVLAGGGGLPIDALTAATSTASWPDEKVRLWYTQSYSLVRFLIRTQYRSSFYKFASYLRDGRPAAESLYRAYGAPYTRLRALELAWRHEIARSAMDRLPAGR